MAKGQFKGLLLLGIALLSGCSASTPAAPLRSETQPPTATQAAIQPGLTQAQPTGLPPTPVATGTPAPLSPAYITEKDNGKTFTYGITVRFGVILDDSRHPLDQLKCEPEPIFGYVSNWSTNGPGHYPIGYEITKAGSCVLTDGDFHVTIVGVDR